MTFGRIWQHGKIPQSAAVLCLQFWQFSKITKSREVRTCCLCWDLDPNNRNKLVCFRGFVQPVRCRFVFLEGATSLLVSTLPLLWLASFGCCCPLGSCDQAFHCSDAASRASAWSPRMSRKWWIGFWASIWLILMNFDQILTIFFYDYLCQKSPNTWQENQKCHFLKIKKKQRSTKSPKTRHNVKSIST